MRQEAILNARINIMKTIESDETNEANEKGREIQEADAVK
jgi:hypothetical protein